MLDVNIDHLMTLTVEERWKKFYISLEEVPRTIVLDRRPKMDISPFRWAPSTWISYGKDEWLHYDDVLANCSGDGLRVTITALLLDGVCTFSDFAILIQVEEDLYELSRLASSPTSPSTFNIIFVRYFKNESPQLNLGRNSSVKARVGVGFIDSAVGNELQYDFTSGWDIQLLTGAGRDNSLVLKIVAGEWQEREFLFT